MSTPPQHTAGESEPAEPKTASGEAPPATPATTAAQSRVRVRDLTRWKIPFHYVPPVLVAVVGVVMLAIGGTVGTFGGWWLAAALPITIGAFLASPWFALLPVAVWVGWLIYVSGAPDDAALSNTPMLVGLMLAGIGAGATVLAQHAVFPATERGAWQASIGRLVPPLDDGEPVELEDHTDEHTVDFAVVEPIEATDEELRAADAAAKEGATIAELPVVAERRAEAKSEAEAGGQVEANDETDATKQAEPVEQMVVVANEADPDAAPVADADAERELAEESVPAAEDDAEAGPPADAETVAEESVAAVAADPKVDLEKAKPEPEPAEDGDNIRLDLRRITELPLDADPTPLDEGGHVTEFAAISEADLTADEDAVEEAPEATAETESESESDDREPSSDDVEPVTARNSDAPLPAATQAGQRNRGSKASSK